MIDPVGKGANDIAQLYQLTIYLFVVKQLYTILVEQLYTTLAECFTQSDPTQSDSMP